MNQDELAELIGLSIDDELPETLRNAVEKALAQNPALMADANTLHAAVEELKALGSERPDTWFVERALQGLLRDHDSARLDHMLKAA